MENSLIKNLFNFTFKGKKKKFEVIATILAKIERLDAAVAEYEMLKTMHNSKVSETAAAQVKEIRKQWIELLDNVCKAN